MVSHRDFRHICMTLCIDTLCTVLLTVYVQNILTSALKDMFHRKFFQVPSGKQHNVWSRAVETKGTEGVPLSGFSLPIF